MPITAPVASIAGFYFFYFAFVGAFSPYFSLYLKHLGYAALEIGVLMSLLQVMRIIAPNLWGWLADHTGRRIAIVRAAALAGLVAYCGLFFGTGFLWLLVTMATLSFFWGASLPLVEAINLARLGQNSAAYGRIRSFGSLGFIVAVLGMGYLLDVAPITVLLPAALLIKLGVAVSTWRMQEAAPPRHDAAHVPILQVLRRREVMALLAACFLMAAAHGPYYVFFSIYLVDHGYAKSAVGWLWSVGVIAEIAVFFLMPRLTRFVSFEAILAASFALAVVRFLIIGWGVDLVALMVVAQLLHAATFGSYHAAAVALVHRHFPDRLAARGQALYTSVSFGAGGTLGSLVSGSAWDTLGPSLTFTFSAACALLGLVLLARRRKTAAPA